MIPYGKYCWQFNNPELNRWFMGLQIHYSVFISVKIVVYARCCEAENHAKIQWRNVYSDFAWQALLEHLKILQEKYESRIDPVLQNSRNLCWMDCKILKISYDQILSKKVFLGSKQCIQVSIWKSTSYYVSANVTLKQRGYVQSAYSQKEYFTRRTLFFILKCL